MKLTNEFYTMLGFAARARACVIGTTAVEMAVRKHAVRLLVLDAEVSEASRAQWEETCRRQRIPCGVAEPAGEAGRRAGKPAAKVIGVTEKLFAQRMRQLWEAECNRMEVED